jgi:anti-sigma factor RsiW
MGGETVSDKTMGGKPLDCGAWKPKLDLYLDGELPAGVNGQDMRAFDAHVRNCPSCAADVLTLVQMKRGVQAAGKRFTPSEALRQKIQSSMAARPLRRSLSWQWAVGMALAGLLLGAALSSSYLGRSRGNEETLQSEVADLHVAALASSSPVDVISTDRHTVKPWFQGKIPFTFNLPELQGSEFSLLGGRVTFLEHSPGAHLIYEVRKHRISVLIFQERTENRMAAESSAMKVNAFSTETWSQDGLRYFVIGDAGAEDIHKLTEMIRGAARV